jgi:nucleotide-binding universal stress UspA family protein
MPNTLIGQLRPATAIKLPGARRAPEPAQPTALDTVLVATDGSTCAERAVRIGADLAERAACELHVHHAAGVEPMATHRAHVHRTGSRPGDELVAGMSGNSLLVLGAHGRRTSASLGLGSLAAAMVCRTPTAAVVVGGTPDSSRHGTITVGIGDGDPKPLLRWACVLAKLTSARLTLLHAVATARPVDRDHGTRVLAEAFRTLRTLSPAIVAKAQLHSGYAHEAVAHCRDSDFLVLGPGECRDGRPGQVTLAGLHHAPCPVVVARA